jgi:ABC-type bacteriocin/lantibiotic exporter with double-glycine peptidase domain
LYLLILALGLLNPGLASPPLSLKALRTEGVVLQTDWWTCGAAALATLHQLLGLPAGEGEVLALALKHMGDRNPRAGLTALALVRASAERGLPLRGYRLDLEGLRDHFARGGLPLILHVTRPELHFVVAVDRIGEWLLLADPSSGRRLLPLPSLLQEKGWSGVVLAPEAPLAAALRARAAQKEWRTWALLRLRSLALLERRLP